MLLYDFESAPNPRRVRIFLAEKGMAVPTRPIDLRAGEQFSAAYRAVNPQCMVPYLQLDDGSGIGEVVAICRYLEEIQPSPPLLGSDPRSKALVAMWDHRVEWEGLTMARDVLRNSVKAFRGRAVAGPVDCEQIPELAERGRQCLAALFADLDARLAGCRHLAGDSFSMADITLLATLELAARVKIRPADEFVHLARWHQAVLARPSATA